MPPSRAYTARLDYGIEMRNALVTGRCDVSFLLSPGDGRRQGRLRAAGVYVSGALECASID
jgi:hypothetical protein